MPFKVVEPISIFFTNIINHPQCSKKEKKSSSRSAEIAAPLGAADRPCDVHPGCWHHCFTVSLFRKNWGVPIGLPPNHPKVETISEYSDLWFWGFGDSPISGKLKNYDGP